MELIRKLFYRRPAPPKIPVRLLIQILEVLLEMRQLVLEEEFREKISRLEEVGRVLDQVRTRLQIEG
jgi:hypothetical protein